MTTIDRPSDLASAAPTGAQAAADQQLKAAHATMWAQGDYPAVAAEVVGGVGPHLVRALDVGPGVRVLDVAAGSGNAAIPAAAAGADVVASDLTPELLEAGRALAADRREPGWGELAWEVADAEALPYPDASFDVVMSCIGVMFAPHHQAAADELLRVTRPGGRIGVLSWTPQGYVGQMFGVMKPYAAPPPPGASPAPLWGTPEHVAELFGDRVEGLTAERHLLPVTAFGTPQEFREFFKASYGPTIAVYRRNADDPDALAALDAGLDALAEGHLDASGTMRWEYLLATATRT